VFISIYLWLYSSVFICGYRRADQLVVSPQAVCYIQPRHAGVNLGSRSRPWWL